MSRMPALFVALVLATLLSTGCASTPDERPEPLPFHVAMVPVAVDVRAILDSEAAGQTTDEEATESKSEPLTLSLTDRGVTQAIAKALSERCFTRVSVLEYPLQMTSEEFYSKEPIERDQHWTSVAASLGADLLIEVQVNYAPDVAAHINNQFWLNLPLFGLGGPFCYFVPDRSYDSSVVLDAFLYDLNPVLADTARLGSAGAKLFYSEVRSETVSLNFVERAGGKFTSYAASIVVPAGLLATKSEHVQSVVHDEVLDTLIDNLVARIHEKRREVIEAPALVNFRLDTDTLRVVRQGEQVQVTGEVILQSGGGVNGIGSLELSAGDSPEVVEARLGEAKFDPLRSGRRSRFLVYPFEGSIEASADASQLKIRVVDSSLNANTRSFTFPIPGAKPASDPAAGAKATPAVAKGRE